MQTFISIGSSCCIKYQIDKYYIQKGKNKPSTLFFDWLVTPIQDVIKLLLTKGEDIYDINNFKIEKEKTKIKDYKILGIHDKEESLKLIHNKYKRRWIRFEQIIKYNKVKIIRLQETRLEEEMIELSKILNKNKLIYLTKFDINFNSNNILNLNINKYKMYEELDWKFDNYDMNNIFEKIESF